MYHISISILSEIIETSVRAFALPSEICRQSHPVFQGRQQQTTKMPPGIGSMDIREHPYSVHLLFGMLTALISYGTGSLAGRLAGCLALAASAFFYGVLKIFGIKSFNVFHKGFPPN